MARGIAGIAGIAMVVAVAGCNFDTSGLGSAGPLGPGGDLDGGGTQDDGSSGDPTEGSMASGGATSGLDDTADGPPMDSGPGGHPAVIISNGPTFDFGPLVVQSHLDHTFLITNDGDADATALELGGLVAPFTLLASDCGDTLAAGDACEVQVRFAPGLFGDYTSELKLGFQDAGVPASASRPVVGRGTGMTTNLVINGGGEDGSVFDIPPDGWTAAAGFSWVATADGPDPVEGSRTIVAGWGPNPGPDSFRLYQQVHLSPLTQWGDAAGLRVHFRAFHRPAWSGDDPTSVVFRFHALDGSVLQGLPSASNSDASWLESTFDEVAPAGTHFVQVELVCSRELGSTCNGHFDGVEIWAQWPG